MTRKTYDPPSEPPDGIPHCRQHDLPMEYERGGWYCPNWHYEELPTCPVCKTELVDDICPACTERNEELLTLVLGDEPYQEPEAETTYLNTISRY